MSMETKNKQERRLLSIRESTIVYDYLKTVITPLNDGFVAYKDNLNDTLVAEQLQDRVPGLKHNHVGHIRRQCLGEIAEVPPERAMCDRILALEKAVVRLNREIQALTSRVDVIECDEVK